MTSPGGASAGELVLVRFVFLRLLGLAYLAAFLSLAPQIVGLVGSQGILPVAEFLARVRSHVGPERYWLLPTLLWLHAGDGALRALAWAGAGAASGLLLGLAPRATLLLCWLLYLSLTVAGQVFLGYQWDGLLLETGLLAVLFAPGGLRPGWGAATGVSWPALWLLRGLLFRLVFSSGVVKLRSGDPAWRGLTALPVHYETQPLPTPLAWYAHTLPGGFHEASVVLMFLVELAVPWLIFGPRRGRLAACAALVGLQALIALTGNYAFFNLLTVALCVTLLDDQVFPASLRARVKPVGSGPGAPAWRGRVLQAGALVLVLLEAVPTLSTVGLSDVVPGPLAALHGLVAPLRSVNSYGLFAVMTTKRPEILVEGSRDGETWEAYGFPWKPGDLRRAPAFVAPHQPRLDWQMWFAALGDWQQSPWFLDFEVRLLEGSPEVLALLSRNPFGVLPPRFVRASLFEYRFTDQAERAREGTWWQREALGPFGPVLSRREGDR